VARSDNGIDRLGWGGVRDGGWGMGPGYRGREMGREMERGMEGTGLTGSTCMHVIRLGLLKPT